MGELRYILLEEITNLCNKDNPSDFNKWLKDNSLTKE